MSVICIERFFLKERHDCHMFNSSTVAITLYKCMHTLCMHVRVDVYHPAGVHDILQFDDVFEGVL